MKELVEVIAKSLVDFPDEVVVTESENEKGTLLELRVAQSETPGFSRARLHGSLHELSPYHPRESPVRPASSGLR